jgi:phage terminase large subunit-like protein
MYLVGDRLIPTHNSLLCSIYFPAWILLLWPETRIALGSYETGFAANFGARVRDIVNRYGPALDVELRTDTKAKSEWAIHKFGGGMICKGRGGPLTGRPADLMILDDVIKNANEAQSQIILDNLWEWYQTVAYSRLGPRAPVVLVGTRWCSQDLHGRLMAEEKVGGEKFEWIHFHAIAKDNDLLGRKPGEALWPERVPLNRLERVAKTRPRWFQACWQGEPMEGQGLHYQPREWRKYMDVGDAWRMRDGLVWRHYRKVDCTIIISLDWAQKGKKDSDRTAFTVSALTPDGYSLILDVWDDRLRQEQNAPALAKFCEKWHPLPEADPLIVAGDDDMLSESMVLECRRYRGIPEIRRMGIRSQSKLVRAQAAIIRSQNGLFLVPEKQEPWFERMADQLSSFNGEDGAEDDIADTFGIMGRLADEFVPGSDTDTYEPQLGAIGYSGSVYGEADNNEGW